MKFNIGKLQIKVLSTMLLASFVPLVVFGLLAIYSLNYFHQIDLKTIESTVLNENLAQMDSAVDKISETLQLQVTFDQTSDISLPDQQLILKQLMLQIPEIEDISFISASPDKFGQETSNLQRNENDFAQDSDLINQTQSEKFKKVVSGQGYISPIRYTLKGPMVTIAQPVKNTPKFGQPTIISVLAANIRLDELQKIIHQAKLGNSGYLYLLDDNGYLVAHSTSASKIGTFIAHKTSAELSRYQSFWDQSVVGLSYKTVKLHATLVAEWPASDADRIVNITLAQIVGASIIILILSLFLGSFLSYRIIKPIEILEKATSAVALGKLDQYITINTKDELEQLGTAFNKMIDGLKRLEELKEEFVFVASHELRTPVTAIKGYLSMIKEGDSGPISGDVKQVLDQITLANDRLVQLVEDLLQVARSEAGRLTIELSDVNISEAVNSVLKELQPLAVQKNIEFVYLTNDPLPMVQADLARLKEVLVNLVGNAIKYTAGSGKVAISHEIANNTLITNIEDSGIGMTEEEQNKLFEKFYRVKNSETSEIQGTGLGLFIVKEIVEKMNGKIWAKSQKDIGSTFSFSLNITPFAKPQAR